MRGHLLPYLNGTAVILLNFSGVIIFYDALRDIFIHISSPEFITLSTVLALRISFCLLVHRALIDTGPARRLEICAAASIAALPTIHGISAAPPVFVTPLIQISFDLLIVILTNSAPKESPVGRNIELALAKTAIQTSEGLRDFLETYCVEELSSLYLYLPTPRCSDDIDAEDILKRLRSNGVVGTRYRIYLDSASAAAKKTLPHLFRRKPTSFDVYRIDQDKLKGILA